MKKHRKHYTPEEKVAILRRHLVEGVPISELCDESGLQPTVFYRWQKGSSKTERRLSSTEDGPTINPNRNESRIWKRRSRRRMKCWPN